MIRFEVCIAHYGHIGFRACGTDLVSICIHSRKLLRPYSPDEIRLLITEIDVGGPLVPGRIVARVAGAVAGAVKR
ncbi:MAG TPA: hypothetical protein PKK36_07090, partial [Kiritimatiellia bacterium]|nr:hypothetical protein [Kiritimatiellia bacterium]